MKKFLSLLFVVLIVGGVFLAACASVISCPPGQVCTMPAQLPPTIEVGVDTPLTAMAAETQEGFSAPPTALVESTPTPFGTSQPGYDGLSTPTPGMYVPETPTLSGPGIIAAGAQAGASTLAAQSSPTFDELAITANPDDVLVEQTICADGSALNIGGWHWYTITLPGSGEKRDLFIDQSIEFEEVWEMFQGLNDVPTFINEPFVSGGGSTWTTPAGTVFTGRLIDTNEVNVTWSTILEPNNWTVDYLKMTSTGASEGQLWQVERRVVDPNWVAGVIPTANQTLFNLADLFKQNGLDPEKSLISIGIIGSLPRGLAVRDESDLDVVFRFQLSPVNDQAILISGYEIVRANRELIASYLRGSGLKKIHIVFVSYRGTEIEDVIQMNIPLDEPVPVDTASAEEHQPPLECDD